MQQDILDSATKIFQYIQDTYRSNSKFSYTLHIQTILGFHLNSFHTTNSLLPREVGDLQMSPNSPGVACLVLL